MKNITILDDSFDLNLSAIYHISIQLSFASYSFCILNSVRNRYIAVKHFNFPQTLNPDNFNKEIKRLLENDEFLNKRYKSVNFSWISSKSTFVPTELLNEMDKTVIMNFNATLDSKEEAEKALLDQGRITQIFAFPSYLSTILMIRIYSSPITSPCLFDSFRIRTKTSRIWGTRMVSTNTEYHSMQACSSLSFPSSHSFCCMAAGWMVSA